MDESGVGEGAGTVARMAAGRTGWRWSFLRPDGSEHDGSEHDGSSLPRSAFPTQSEAEAWLGESWADLAELGVDAVTLWRDGVQVYGPMSLRASD